MVGKRGRDGIVASPPKLRRRSVRRRPLHRCSCGAIKLEKVQLALLCDLDVTCL
jgi:hypothetical protein